jgi:stearoyl-CoA desaturase (Delta-9 desaturase)
MRIDSPEAALSTASALNGVHQPFHELDDRRIAALHILPILSIHLICLGVIWVGISWIAVAVALLLYVVRMFAITAFYHRYFSHRTFRTSRVIQFAFAAIGASSAQRGPVWWAAHHREHHRHSDTDPDLHSPTIYGLIWSHMGWFLTERGRATNWAAVPDWQKVPELRWLEKYHVVPVIALLGLTALLGWILGAMWPSLGTGPAQMVVWGFGISTTVLYHSTFTINSLAHTFGSQRFKTRDDSRNNWLLAILTLGEGWHNNHHYCPGTVRQGFYWWEFDPTYYGLVAMSWLRLVSDLRPVPERVYAAAEEHRQKMDERGELP